MKNKLEQYKNVVWKYALKYQWAMGIPIEDCVQIGYISLITALRTYDPAKSKETTHVMNSVLNGFRRNIGKSREYDPAKVNTTVELTDNDMDLFEYNPLINVELSLDREHFNPDFMEWLEENLTGNEYRVISLHYFDGIPLKQIGLIMGINPYVFHNKIKSKLKNKLMEVRDLCY